MCVWVSVCSMLCDLRVASSLHSFGRQQDYYYYYWICFSSSSANWWMMSIERDYKSKNAISTVVYCLLCSFHYLLYYISSGIQFNGFDFKTKCKRRRIIFSFIICLLSCFVKSGSFKWYNAWQYFVCLNFDAIILVDAIWRMLKCLQKFYK